MPFISVNVGKKLTQEEITNIRTELGQSISVIATKSEAVTLIQINDGNVFFKGGVQRPNAAFVDIRLFGEADFEEKNAYTAIICKTLKEHADADETATSINFLELNTWGGGGKLNRKD